jgi:hypothetical protein
MGGNCSTSIAPSIHACGSAPAWTTGVGVPAGVDERVGVGVFEDAAETIPFPTLEINTMMIKSAEKTCE